MDKTKIGIIVIVIVCMASILANVYVFGKGFWDKKFDKIRAEGFENGQKDVMTKLLTQIQTSGQVKINLDDDNFIILIPKTE